MNNQEKLIKFAEIVKGTHLERLARFYLNGGSMTPQELSLVNSAIKGAKQ